MELESLPVESTKSILRAAAEIIRPPRRVPVEFTKSILRAAAEIIRPPRRVPVAQAVGPTQNNKLA